VSFRKIGDLDVRGKRVLVREDLNVPMKDGAVADFTRVDAAIKTIADLHERGARTIVVSHLGARRRSQREVLVAPGRRRARRASRHRRGVFGRDGRPRAEAAVASLRDGDVLLLENVRFHPGEETNDPAFAAQLASLADLYVNDAFGTAHRAHASTVGVAHLLPNAAGYLMEDELASLASLTDNPAKPFVCAIGGAKVKDKVGVFTHLLDRVDAFCIGGGMANTFLAAKGVNVGNSLRDDDLDPAKAIVGLARARGVALHLPVDAVVSISFNADGEAHTVPIDAVGSEMILDIGPKTAAAYAGAIEGAKTIVFNGPMGVYEKPAYQRGTRSSGRPSPRRPHAAPSASSAVETQRRPRTRSDLPTA